jgi:phosphonate transport system substrate-binding protein
MPYFNSAKLAEIHAALRDQLAELLQRPVAMSSAATIDAFHRNTLAGDYDLVLTAPHMGAAAEQKAGFQRVLMTANRSRAVFVAPLQGGIENLSQLRGKTLLLPPASTIIHHLALNSLRRQGLEAGKDFTLQTAISHNNVMLAIINQDGDAAAFGMPTWESANPGQKQQLRIIGQSEEIPGFLLMAHPRLASALVAQIRQGLLKFEQAEAGKKYLEAAKLKGFQPIDDATMWELLPYASAIFGPQP